MHGVVGFGPQQAEFGQHSWKEQREHVLTSWREGVPVVVVASPVFLSLCSVKWGAHAVPSVNPVT